jgi:hypothetical protein
MYAASVARRLPIHVLSCALVPRFPLFCSSPSEAIFESLVVSIILDIQSFSLPSKEAYSLRI